MTGADTPDDRDLEIARLRHGINDLVGLLALSATWTAHNPPDIGRTLVEALFAMLKLDFAFVELTAEAPRPPEEFRRLDPGLPPLPADGLGEALRDLLGGEPGAWPSLSRRPYLDAEISIATLPLGLGHGFGTIVAGSRRADFPTEPERLLLSVARNQALLALQEAEVQRRQQTLAGEASATALVEGIPGFVAMLAPDGSVQRVNRQIIDYCGLPLEELRHWGTNGIVHPEDMPQVAAMFGAAIASGTPYAIEQRLRRFDGEYRWFDNRGRPQRGEDGAIVAWHVLLTDIDDRRRAEEAVRASERDLRRQFETFPQMLWSATAEGNIDYCNERLLAYSGLSADEVTDDQWVNLLHPDDREPTAKIWLGCVATGEPYTVEVRQFHVADRTHRWVLTKALPLRDADGRIVKWYGSCVDIHDRKLAEEALRASERHLSQLVETIPQNLFGAAPDGAVNYLNPQMLEWFGRGDEKIMASEWVHLAHPDDRDGAIAAWLETVAAGTPYRREVRFLHHSGEYRWCDNLARPLRDADGNIVAWHGVVNDIHDRKLAEEDLAERERKLREAHDHLAQAQRLSHTGSFTTDVKADTHIWSDELYRILEYDRKEVPTFRAFRDRIHADDVARFDAGFKRAMADRSEFDETFRIVTPRGNIKHLHAVAHFLPGMTERPIVMGSIQDVTELRQREDELRRSAHFLAVGERISLTGSFAWDMETDRIAMSDQLRQLHELDEDAELTGAEFRKRIHPDDIGIFEEKSAELMSGRESIEYEFRLITARGRVKYVRAFVQMLEQPDRPPQRVGAVQDITQRRIAEETLDKVRSELTHVTRVMSLGQLTASIAHEVNQPLAGIITNASTCLRMLAAEEPDIEGAIKTAQRSIRDGNRASEVIRRLRNLYRKQDFVPEPVNLNEAAEEVIAICAHDLQRRRIALSVNLDPALPVVVGDRIQLQQVILNLVLNAADAIGDADGRPRQIVIETGLHSPEGVRLSVRDTGQGIAEEDLGRLFDAFYTTKPNGMGIGLSVSRSILEQHDGRLWAARNDGPGATFSFSVPLGPGAPGQA